MTTVTYNVPDVPSNLEDATSLLRQLAAAASKDEIQFLLFAEKVEKSGIWMAAKGAGSFADYLSNYICDTKRYTTGIEAIHDVGIDAAMEIGIFAVKTVVRRVEQRDVRQRVYERLHETARESGRPVPERTARDTADRISREEGVKKSPPVVSELDRLRRELDEKQEVITRLTAENKKLSAENQKLRDRLGREGPAGRAKKGGPREVHPS